MLKNAIITEGKSDYYYLEFFGRKLGLLDNSSIIPGTGSSSARPIISLYIGWAKNFVVILDDDEEGRKQKTAYLEDFGEIIRDRVFTLGDIDSSWSGYEIEDLVEDDVKQALLDNNDGSEIKRSKKALSNAIEYALISDSNINIDGKTAENFQKVNDFILRAFSTQAD